MATAENVSNGLDMADPTTPTGFERTPSAANESGTTYEYKMALLMYLRAQRLTKKFWIGVNAKHVGAFDDLVLIYLHNDNKYKLVIQLKHKDDPKFTLKHDAMKAEAGPFSLNKYLNSVQDKLQEGGHFDNTQFVLFTNAILEPKLRPIVGKNPLTEEFLSTAGHQGEIYSLKMSDDVCEAIKRKPGAEDFINKFVICCHQANVDDLDDLIKQEILIHFGRIIPNLCTIFDTLLDQVKKWWKLKGETHYLTETWDEWVKLAPHSSLLQHIQFDESEIVALKDIFNNNPRVHLVYPKADIQLRSSKLLQVLQMMKSKRFYFVQLDDLRDGNVMERWKDGWFDYLVVDSENTDAANRHLKRLINLKLKDGGKYLILVSDGNLSIKSTEVEWLSKSDICMLNQLNEASREHVLNRFRDMSLQEDQILTRDVTGELLSKFLLEEDDLIKFFIREFQIQIN